MIKPNTKVTIAIDFDLAGLSRVTDARLAMLWHVAQANPAPHGDEQAGEAVRKIGQEIVRRWLASTSPDMYHHQARDYYWHHLGRFASHRDGDWRPDPEKIAKHEAEQTTSASPSDGEYRYCGANLSRRTDYPLTCHRRIGHDGLCSPRRDQDAQDGAGAVQSDGHICTLPPTQRLACGHCRHQLCEDCEHCPCSCQCARDGDA